MGLVAHYDMQETSGTQIADSLGNSSYATYQGGADISAKTVEGPGGLYPNAIAFDGNPDYASTPSIDFTETSGSEGTNAISVSYWIRIVEPLASCHLYRSTPDNIVCSYADSTQDCGLHVKGNVGSNWSLYLNPYSDGEWVHIVEIYDKGVVADYETSRYKNGVQQPRTGASGKSNDNSNNFNALTFDIARGASPLLFAVAAFSGFKVYDHALSQAEIDALYAEGQADIVPSCVLNIPPTKHVLRVEDGTHVLNAPPLRKVLMATDTEKVFKAPTSIKVLKVEGCRNA